MKCWPKFDVNLRRRVSGFKLIEVMIAVAIAGMVMALVMTLYLFGMRSFGAIGNYAEMDAKSRQALDLMLREVRQSSTVVGFQTNGPTPWLSVAYTNAPGITNTFVWDSTTNGFTWTKTGRAPRTLLSGCTKWSFACYQRAPNSDGTFVTTPTGKRTKLINLSWTCSRTNVGQITTESMVTAEVVLRNLQE
jgi:hypothetical protein